MGLGDGSVYKMLAVFTQDLEFGHRVDVKARWMWWLPKIPAFGKQRRVILRQAD